MSGRHDLLRYYEYDSSSPLNPTESTVTDELGYKVLKVYYDSANCERVPALFVLPKHNAKVPCVIFLHGYGGRKEDALEVLGPLVAQGYALMSIDAAMQGERKKEGRELISPDAKAFIGGMIQTVVDLRRAVDYVGTRPEIDPRRIVYAGGSQGGVFGAVFIGVEPRIVAAALMAAGGDINLISEKSQLPLIEIAAETLREQNVTPEMLQQLVEPVEPCNFICMFSPRPVQFHLGKHDTIVPAEAGNKLYECAGQPKEVYWYDSGHELPIEVVLPRVLKFLDENLRQRSG